MADEGLKHRTIKMYMSGVCYQQKSTGLGDPFQSVMPHLHYVMKGIKSNKAKKGGPLREWLPITPEILRQLRKVWAPSVALHDTKLIWAASCLCFFAFMCTGELTVLGDNSYDASVHLSLTDVAIDDPRRPSSLRSTIKRS